MISSRTLSVMPELLSEEECREFIGRAESQGYLGMKGDYPPSYRDNDRIVIDDEDLADRLFQRFRHKLPERISVNEESWALVGLNPRFRGCRYRDGQKFVRHRDGAFGDSDGSRSFLTLMLYLNDHSEFQGGHTRFYEDRWDERVVRSVPPQTGTGIVFEHALWHDGQSVTNGVKYVLRTDVMYRRAEGTGEGHTGYVWALAQFADGTLVSGSRDKTIVVWKQRRPVQSLTYHRASVTSLATNGETLWSGSRDRHLAIWRKTTSGFEKVRSFQAHDGAVLSLTTLADGSVLSTGADDAARLWSKSGELRRTWKTGSWPWSGLQRPDGRFLVGCDDGSLRLLSGHSQESSTWQCAPAGITSVALSAGVVLAGCQDGAIRRYQTHGRELSSWSAHRGPVTSLLVLDDGRVVSGSEDDGVRVWKEGKSLELVRHDDFVRALCLSKGESSLVTASYDGSIRWTSLG